MPSTVFRDRRDVVRRGAAAAADDVHQALLRPVGDSRPAARRLVVAAEGVGRTGIRVGAETKVSQTREFLDVLAQLLGAERAVEAEGERTDVVERVPEGFRRLARQRAAGGVGDRAGDHHRPAAAGGVEELLDGEQRRLGVQRVEHRLDQQQVGAAVDQAADGLGVGLDQLVEGDVAVAGSFTSGEIEPVREVGPSTPGDEARLGRILRREFVAGLARQPGAGDVQFIDDGLQLVVGLRDRRRVEGVRLEDVGAGGEVFGVDALMTSGFVSSSRSLLPLRSCGWSAKRVPR